MVALLLTAQAPAAAEDMALSREDTTAATLRPRARPPPPLVAILLPRLGIQATMRQRRAHTHPQQQRPRLQATMAPSRPPRTRPRILPNPTHMVLRPQAPTAPVALLPLLHPLPHTRHPLLAALLAATPATTRAPSPRPHPLRPTHLTPLPRTVHPHPPPMAHPLPPRMAHPLRTLVRVLAGIPRPQPMPATRRPHPRTDLATPRTPATPRLPVARLQAIPLRLPRTLPTRPPHTPPPAAMAPSPMAGQRSLQRGQLHGRLS